MAAIERTAAPLQVADRVELNEPGIRTRYGTVHALKWSSVSGWWADVEVDGEGTWVVRLQGPTVTKIDEDALDAEAADDIDARHARALAARTVT